MHTANRLIARNSAYSAGLRAGMEPADPFVVPAQFAANADDWERGYREIQTGLGNQRPGVMDMPSDAKRSSAKAPKAAKPARIKVASQPSPAPLPRQPASMLAILDSQLEGQPEARL